MKHPDPGPELSPGVAPVEDAADAPSISPQSLGRELRQLRTLKSESLRSVGDATGYSSAYLLKLEKGDVKSPSPHLLAALAKHYVVSYESLMRLAGYQTADHATQPREPSLLADALIGADLSRDEQDAIAAFVSSLRARRR